MNMPFNLDGLLERIGIIRDDSVGIALSGGGARGFSHLGVLRAFEKFGIKPNVISGVSAGSIAAVLYSAGLDPRDIMECFSQASGLGSFMELSLPKESFLKLNKFSQMLDSWLPVKKLEELKIPTIVCATDLDNAKSVGWVKGDIVPRVLASCSIPIIFSPVKIDGVNYVDGGVLRNLPAWAIRDYCKKLFGVNCSPLDKDFQYTGSMAQLAMRSYTLMSKANTSEDMRLCDHVIMTTSIKHVRTFQLSAMEEAMTKGYDAACKVLEKIY